MRFISGIILILLFEIPSFVWGLFYPEKRSNDVENDHGCLFFIQLGYRIISIEENKF